MTIAGGRGGDGGGIGGGGDSDGGGGHSNTFGGGGGRGWHGFSHSAHIVHGTWSFATNEVALVLAENASMKIISKKGNELAI